MKRPLILVASLVVFSALLIQSASSGPRKVLAEMFTSTTCEPCYAADNFYFNQWLPNYGGADQIVTIAYHVWWPPPGNDPMYLANPAPVQTRNSYYGNNAAPNMRIDGFINGGAGYNTWPGAIEPRFLDPSPITITLSGTRDGNTLNMNAAIRGDSPLNSSTWSLHWVVLEDDIYAPQWNGTAYVPFTHHWVHRGMYPDANGSPITLSQGQTVDMPMTITMGTAWVPDHCRVVVFVQNNTDKKVQNAEVIRVDGLTGVGEEGFPATYSLSQNYPNPFNPSTSFRYDLSERSVVTLKVFNLLGQEVRTLTSGEKAAGSYQVEWNGRADDGSEVPSGVYLYQLNAGKFRETRKMMLLR
ncbi:MAG: Omp28-related outer membrane protein [Ignavibacteriae bacterium]|nr:Omp28-related outer membrane protein [Ignavibacteriota bacterium]